MGWAVAFGLCYVCSRPFAFNPVKVPSVKVCEKCWLPVDKCSCGVGRLAFSRQPICKSCIEQVNEERRKRGRPEFTVPPDAYEPVDEQELGVLD